MKKVLLVHNDKNVATYDLGTRIKGCGYDLTTMSLRSLQKSLDSVGETDLRTFDAVILSGEIPCHQHRRWWGKSELYPVRPNPYLDVYQQLRDRYGDRLLVILHSTDPKLPVRDVKVSTESEIQKLLQSKLS